jgi:hypothetical protein
MLVKEEHALNTSFSICHTVLGIVILLKDEQLEKAYCLISDNPSGRVTLSNEEQSRNALSSIDFTPVGIVMLVKDEQSQKA